RAGVFEHAGQQREVVVLHEDHRWFIPDLVQDGLGELLVDAAILLPVVGVEARPRAGDVAKGPERLVGHAVVVPLLLLLAQPDAPQGVGGFLGRDPHPAAVVGHGAVGVAAPVRHPGAATGAQHGVEGGGQTARRPRAADGLALVDVYEWFPVGHDDEAGP